MNVNIAVSDSVLTVNTMHVLVATFFCTCNVLDIIALFISLLTQY